MSVLVIGRAGFEHVFSDFTLRTSDAQKILVEQTVVTLDFTLG